MSTLDRFSLKGKTAIITGASQGIGESIAIGMAEAGASVVLAARSVDKLENVAAKVQAIGAKCIKVKTDVQKLDDIEAMVEATVAEFGTVDCLVNNAGINLVTPALKITEEEWDAVLDTNLTAYFMCSQAAGRQGRGGLVISTASVAMTRVPVSKAPQPPEPEPRAERTSPRTCSSRESCCERSTKESRSTEKAARKKELGGRGSAR